MKAQWRRVQPIVGIRRGFIWRHGTWRMVSIFRSRDEVGIPGRENVTDESKSIPYGCPIVEYY